MATTGHIIYSDRGRIRIYLRDINGDGLPVTTEDINEALELSMRAAVIIAQDLDKPGGWRWFVTPKHRNN